MVVMTDGGGCRGGEEVEVAWMWMVAVVVVTVVEEADGDDDGDKGGVMVRKERLLIPTVLTVGHKAAKGKSDRGSKRKAESEIAPTSDPKEAVCFYYNTKGHWKRSYPKYLKDLTDEKVEKGSHSGLKESRRLKHGELNLVMGNRKITLVTRIENHNGNVILNVGSSDELDKSKLWHSRLGYVNKKCIAQLQKDGVLESFNFKSNDVSRRGVFLEKEMISKEDSGCKIDLEEIQESADEEPIVNTNTQQEVVTPIKLDDISLPISRTSGRVSKPPQFNYGFHIKEDKISDSTLSELDEPANYKEAMAIPEAAKWKEAMKSEIQSMYDNQVWNLVDTTPGLKTMGCKWIFKKKTDMDGKVHTYKARLVV
ncbi:retrotransposon protein, putative, ty1-copia subclass [Tanacetum coccineum]